MSLFARTAQLGCYRLGPQDAVTRELWVLQQGLEGAAGWQKRLEALPFPQRWAPQRQRLLCRLRGLTVPEGCTPAQLAQAAQLAWQAIPPEPQAVCAALEQLGVAGAALTEDPAGLTVQLEGEPGGFLPQRQAVEAFVQGLLPAGVVLKRENPPLTWALFDSLGNTVAQLEEKNLTWAQLDAYGQQP